MQSTTVTEEQYINKSELGNLSVKDLFFKYIRFLPLFILSLAVALIGAWLYLRYATPIYRASGTLMIKSDKQASNRGDERLNQLFMNDGTQNIQNEIEVLKSRPLMERVVDSLDLEVSYYAVGKIRSPNIYKQGPFLMEIMSLTDSVTSFSLNIKFINNNTFIIDNNSQYKFSFGEKFQNRYGTFRLNRNLYASIGKEYTVNWQPTVLAAGQFAGGVMVTPKQGTGIVIISLETTNPQLSADIINQLMKEYGEQTVEDKNAEAKRRLAFINKSLDLIQHEKDSIQRILLDYQIANNLIDPETQTKNYFVDIQETDATLFSQLGQKAVADQIEDYLKDKANDFETVPSSLGLTDITLNAKIQEYNQIQLVREGMLKSNILPGHPSVQEQNAILEKLRTGILESLKNFKTSIDASAASIRRRGATAEAQAKSMPAKLKRAKEIEMELSTKTGIYSYLMEKKVEASISEASTISSSKSLERAYASSSPVKPNKRAIQLLAILIGIGLPALFIFILEVVNDKITTRFDIEKITQAPVLGEIGHSYADNTLVVGKTNRGMVSEQFRIIRSNLQYVLNKVEKPVILVTSSFSGEGKSFVTTNLGAVMALAGKKTIVLEFDIRKPKIIKGLGLSRGRGITNYLLSKANIEDLPTLVPGYDNLYVLPCGPVPPNPSELLLEPRVDDLFNYLKANFDVVLIDTAPVGMVSDAMTLSKFANCTLYIVRQGHTYKKQIALIDEFYREAKLPKVSIIINDVKVKPGYGYYGYGRYGYGYGYASSYYEEEHPPQSALTRLFAKLNPKKWFK